MSKDGKSDQLEKSLQRMMKTTNTFDNFQKMIKTTHTFDEELELAKAQSRKAISDAFARMINLSYELEKSSKRAISKETNQEIIAEAKKRRGRVTYNDDDTWQLTKKLINCLPSKYRHLPHAFRRNPKLVIKYFVGMILGRVLAIILYIIAAFVPAIPVPESVQGWVGKPIKALGSAVVSTRGLIADPSMIIGIVTNIPTDINKLLQKIGEFFQFYGKRAWAFTVKAVRHPRLAYYDLTKWSREHGRFIVRLCRSALALTCSFIMIKLAMIFLLPLFGGVAITVAGLKISILLFVVVRMIVDKIGEFIGTKVFGKLSGIYNRSKRMRNE
ncbi:MAG: hypothetical protein IJ862_03675 [Selenomonadaceae bacterium]|nr:hypothetical protein [Selenomonadaceae bacterium]